MIPDTEIQSLTGKVSLKDQFHWALLGRAAWKCAIMVPVLVFLFLFLIQLFSREPITLASVFTEAIYPSLVSLFLIIFWTVLLVFLGHRRLTEKQLTVKWTFSAESLSVADEVGNRITKPWSQVNAVKYSSKGVRIYYKPMGSIWIAHRLLPHKQLLKLKALTETLNLE